MMHHQVFLILGGCTLMCAEAGGIPLEIIHAGLRSIMWLEVPALVVPKGVANECGLSQATGSNHQEIHMYVLPLGRQL